MNFKTLPYYLINPARIKKLLKDLTPRNMSGYVKLVIIKENVSSSSIMGYGIVLMQKRSYPLEIMLVAQTIPFMFIVVKRKIA